MKVTAVRPRATLWVSRALPSWSCCMRRTSTDRTCEPAVRTFSGTGRVAFAAQLPCRTLLVVGTGIRWVPSGSPSSQAISSPWVPVL